MSSIKWREALQKKLLPAITFEDSADAIPVANAILESGLTILEIQCRTKAAFDAISAIRKTFPEMVVGAGTMLKKEHILLASNAGAQFGLSPGYNPSVCAAAEAIQLPFIPGVMTPSEVESAYESGYFILKLFPAEQLGGIAFLKALQGPYSQLPIEFIPMGGVNAKNAAAYAQQKNVIALGGSWLATPDLIAAKDYRQISENVRIALDLIN